MTTDNPSTDDGRCPNIGDVMPGEVLIDKWAAECDPMYDIDTLDKIKLAADIGAFAEKAAREAIACDACGGTGTALSGTPQVQRAAKTGSCGAGPGPFIPRIFDPRTGTGLFRRMTMRKTVCDVRRTPPKPVSFGPVALCGLLGVQVSPSFG